jgi:hypothetical protein
VASRNRYIAELREMLEEGSPVPEKDWNHIYVFSGPEITFEDPPHESGPYNQTQFRLETGIDIARQITALRLNKKYDDVTAEDIRMAGPTIHFDGYSGHNTYMRTVIAEKRLGRDFGFPDEKFILPDEKSRQHTAHTGEQIAHFPDEIIADDGKFVIVSDLYHLPRIKRYLGGKYDAKKIPTERVVFYYAAPARVPVRAALREARNIHPYHKRGFLLSD